VRRRCTLDVEVIHVLTNEIELVELAPQPTAVVRGEVPAAGLPAFLGAAFGEVMQALSAQGLGPVGPPIGRYVPTAQGFIVEAGFPTTAAVTPVGRVVPIELPGGPAARLLHRGDYSTIAPAYDAVRAWLEAEGYVPAGEPWEAYLDGPDVAEPRTFVYQPCRRG
jgi:effector-binding domain-containing protein